MNNEIAICTVALGNAYKGQQLRLLDSLQASGNDFCMLWWKDAYPVGSPTFEESLYGFKVYAVREAIEKGFKRIVWLDTACIVNSSLDYLFDDYMPPVVAVKDDSKLINTISDKALRYYITPDISRLHLVGGSLYAFDFNKKGCDYTFEHWAKAERDGMFGTMQEQVSEQINKHRHDESCMSMALWANNIQPVTPAQARYCSGPDSVILKKHFK